jgi:hypothetical protein
MHPVYVLDIAAVARAAATLLPHKFAPLVDISRPTTPVVITGVLSLEYGLADSEAAKWRRTARTLCGSRVASASWLILLDLPESKIAEPTASPYRALVARTATGWVAWYPGT